MLELVRRIRDAVGWGPVLCIAIILNPYFLLVKCHAFPRGKSISYKASDWNRESEPRSLEFKESLTSLLQTMALSSVSPALSANLCVTFEYSHYFLNNLIWLNLAFCFFSAPFLLASTLFEQKLFWLNINDIRYMIIPIDFLGAL